MTNDVYTEMKHLCIFLSINFLQAIMLCIKSCEMKDVWDALQYKVEER